MPKTIIPSQLSATVERVTNAQQFELVNGERVKRGSEAGEIQSAAKILKQHSGDPPPPRGGTLNLAAFGVLSSLGVTLSHEKKSYSLLDDQTNTQVVENISIFDPIYATLTNTPVEAKDKFSNNKDPFYELDDSPPSDEKKRRDKILEDKLTPKVEKITTDLIKLNLSNPKSPTLKQFINAKDSNILLLKK
jgi:hypothetical protein